MIVFSLISWALAQSSAGRHLMSQLSRHQQCQHGECSRKGVLSSQVHLGGEKKDAVGVPQCFTENKGIGSTRQTHSLLTRVTVWKRHICSPRHERLLMVFHHEMDFFLSNLHVNHKPRWEE